MSSPHYSGEIRAVRDAGGLRWEWRVVDDDGNVVAVGSPEEHYGHSQAQEYAAHVAQEWNLAVENAGRWARLTHREYRDALDRIEPPPSPA